MVIERQKIISKLQTKTLGRNLQVLESVDSTNEQLKRLKSQCTIIANRQTGGRGRGENKWYSPPNSNIYMSFSIALNQFEKSNLPPFSIIIGVGIHRAIKKFTQKELSLKWPNDLYLEGKKVAGILCEIFPNISNPKFLIAGIGLNVNIENFPPELALKATSLFIEEGKIFDRSEIIASILNETEPLLLLSIEGKTDFIIKEFRERCNFWGRKIKVNEMEGIMKDISNKGSLIIETTNNRLIEISSGTVEFI